MAAVRRVLGGRSSRKGSRERSRYLVVLGVAVAALIGFFALDRVARAQGSEEIVFPAETITAGDTGRYLYKKFTMPEGVSRVDVSLTKASGSAVTGLGIYDQRGAEYGTEGFRGIYGEEFQQFFIEEETASPAFVPGPIEPGEWTIIVPVFRAVADQVTVKVELTRDGSGGGAGGGQGGGGLGGGATGGGEPGGGGQTEPDGTQVVADCPEGETAAEEGDDVEKIDGKDAGWYRGDLHDHTTHSSDSCGSGSARTPEEFAEAVKDEGLDFVSLTDHNVTTQNRSLSEISAADEVLVMPGLEMTNWFHGHATVTGLEPGDWLDWRQRPRPAPLLGAEEGQPDAEERIDAFLDASEQLDTYTSAAHPAAGPIGWQFFAEAQANPDKGGKPDPDLLPDGLETWTGPFQPDDDATIEQWDGFLNRAAKEEDPEDFRIVANGASDVHGFDNDQGFALGHPTTVTYADELSKDEVVDALEAGRSFITCLPEGPELYLSATARKDDDDPDNDQEQMVGGTIYGDADTTADVSVVVRGGEGRVLRIIRDGAEAISIPITEDRQEEEIPQPIGAGGFVRAELRASPEAEPENPRSGETGMHAMTNPIFLERGDVPNDAEQGIAEPPDGDLKAAACPPQEDGQGGEPGGGGSGGGGSGGDSGGEGPRDDGQAGDNRGDRSGEDDDGSGRGQPGAPSLGPPAPALPAQRTIRLFADPRRTVPGRAVRYRFRALVWAPDRPPLLRRRLGPRAPLAGATVTFAERQGVTDARGYVSFTARVAGRPLPVASASKPGFTPAAKRLLPPRRP